MANYGTHNRILQPLPSENRTIFELRDETGRNYSPEISKMLQAFFATIEVPEHADRIPSVVCEKGVIYVEVRNHNGTPPYDNLSEAIASVWLGIRQLALHADIGAFVVDSVRAQGEPIPQAYRLLSAVDVTPEVHAELDELNSSPLAAIQIDESRAGAGMSLDDELDLLLSGQ